MRWRSMRNCNLARQSTVLKNHVQLLGDGVQFPPVVAFRDGTVLGLAGEFHRWYAHKVIDADSVDADIRWLAA